MLITSDGTVVTSGRFWVVRRLHSHASWRRPAVTAIARAPAAAKRIKGGDKRSTFIHCRNTLPDEPMSGIVPWPYLTVTNHPRAVRPNHRHHRGLVVVLVRIDCLTPQMPAAASDHSALAVAYDHRTTTSMVGSRDPDHVCSRVTSVRPDQMTIMIGQ